jgi:hypothetical protein
MGRIGAIFILAWALDAGRFVAIADDGQLVIQFQQGAVGVTLNGRVHHFNPVANLNQWGRFKASSFFSYC